MPSVENTNEHVAPSAVHTYDLLVLEKHLDTFGHVNNATYLELFEEARWDWITANGYGLKRVRESGFGPVILEINLKFIHELKLRQKIKIESRMLSYDKKIGVVEQEIKNEAGQVCAVARFTMGLFDTNARKLVLPTPEWLKAIS